MKRNPIGTEQNLGQHNRKSSLRNGKFVKGPARGRKGMGRGGKLKR